MAGVTNVNSPGACAAPKKNPPGPSTFGLRGRNTVATRPLRGSYSDVFPIICAVIA